MRYRNGHSCRKLKTQMGRTYWIRMKPAEVAEVMSMRATVVLAPIALLIAWAWAAGLLK